MEMESVTVKMNTLEDLAQERATDDQVSVLYIIIMNIKISSP